MNKRLWRNGGNVKNHWIKKNLFLALKLHFLTINRNKKKNKKNSASFFSFIMSSESKSKIRYVFSPVHICCWILLLPQERGASDIRPVSVPVHLVKTDLPCVTTFRLNYTMQKKEKKTPSPGFPTRPRLFFSFVPSISSGHIWRVLQTWQLVWCSHNNFTFFFRSRARDTLITRATAVHVEGEKTKLTPAAVKTGLQNLGYVTQKSLC